ncbi:MULTISPECIES: WhiB family transcriptional regulator [unclassified Nonomuraea]|uniref:WhiB family transcriptional regulator n=1 Tax=unclassified Nonomuraea TaxID=2593643 RepID=UPI0033FC25AF
MTHGSKPTNVDRSLTAVTGNKLTGLLKETPLVLLAAVQAAGPACQPSAAAFTGPDAFEEESQADRLAREEAAMKVCAGCPARSACLDYALAVRPREGVWAGHTADEIIALAYGLTGFERVTPMSEVA